MSKKSVLKEIKEATETQLSEKIMERYGAEQSVVIHTFLAGDGSDDIKPKIIAIMKKEYDGDRFLQTYIDRRLGLGDFA